MRPLTDPAGIGRPHVLDPHHVMVVNHAQQFGAVAGSQCKTTRFETRRIQLVPESRPQPLKQAPARNRKSDSRPYIKFPPVQAERLIVWSKASDVRQRYVPDPA